MIPIKPMRRNWVTSPGPDWVDDSMRWRGRVLEGKHAHWCPDYDYLPIDETCPEWPCPCDEGKS